MLTKVRPKFDMTLNSLCEPLSIPLIINPSVEPLSEYN